MSDSTNATTKTGIPLFDGTNFNNWLFRLSMVLDEKDLTTYIEDDIATMLEKETDSKKKAEIRKAEKQCKNIIVQSVHDGQLENIKDKSTAKQMVNSLKSIYERKSIAGQLFQRRQLLTMKFSDGDEMSQHILNFDRKIRELKSCGAKMEDMDIVCHLLVTLPKAYDNLVTAIETMDQSKITLDFVKSRLLDEYAKRNSGASSGKATPVAMNANITCFRCHKTGHIKSQCTQKRKKNKSNSSKFKKEGEGANNAKTSDGATSMSAICEHTNKATVMHAANTTKHAVPSTRESTHIKFVLDSGATEHMVNKESYFNKLNPTDEIKITVAKKDASLCAKQRGDIHVRTFHNGDCSTKAIRNALFVKDLHSNLLSIRSLTKLGYRIVFEGDTADVTFNGKTVFIAQAAD